MVKSANTDCMVLWQTSKSGKGPVRALSDGLVEEEGEENADMQFDAEQPAKKQRLGITKATKGPREVCPKFGTPAGCTSSEKDPRVPAWRWRARNDRSPPGSPAQGRRALVGCAFSAARAALPGLPLGQAAHLPRLWSLVPRGP